MSQLEDIINIVTFNTLDIETTLKSTLLSKNIKSSIDHNIDYITKQVCSEKYGDIIEFTNTEITTPLEFMKNIKTNKQFATDILKSILDKFKHNTIEINRFMNLIRFIDIRNPRTIYSVYTKLFLSFEDISLNNAKDRFKAMLFILKVMYTHANIYILDIDNIMNAYYDYDRPPLINIRMCGVCIVKCKYLLDNIQHSDNQENDKKEITEIKNIFQNLEKIILNFKVKNKNKNINKDNKISRIYTGPKGGRYYLIDGRKVYLRR